MRHSFLLSTLLHLSACSSDPKVLPLNEDTTTKKIASNQSAASNAQDEYKKLQARRDKE